VLDFETHIKSRLRLDIYITRTPLHSYNDSNHIPVSMAYSDTLPVEEPQDPPTAITRSATAPLPTPDDPKAKALVSVNSVGSSRPGGLSRQNSAQTQYMSMLLAVDTVPRLHNILSSFFTCRMAWFIQAFADALKLLRECFFAYTG
jgi:hypothetical protein